MRYCLHTLFVIAAALPSLAATYPLDFESAADAVVWRASGGTLALSDARARHGRQSLHFAWTQPGASLTFADAEALAALAVLGEKDFAGTSFALWLRWPRVTREVLRAELLAGGQVVGRGWWGLGYAGWRPLGAPLAAFGLTRGTKVDAVRLTPPGAAGELWIDWVQPNLRALPGRNPQHPWMVNGNLKLDAPLARPDDWDTVRLSRDDLADGRPWLPRRTAAPADDLARLTQRLATGPVVPARGRGLAPGVLDGLTEAVRKTWGIAADGSLRGAGTSASDFHNPPGGLSTADYCPLLGRFRDAAAKASATEWPLVQALLTDLVAYTVDQGMAFGSAFAEPFGPYGLRNHLASFRELRACLDDPALRREFVLQGVQLLMPGADDPSRGLLGPVPYGDTDWLHGYHNYLPQMIACLDDPADRWQFWGAYLWCMDYITLSPDLTEPDGGMYHHGMVHYGYSGYSFPGLVNALSPFRDTSLRPRPATLLRLKETARWMAWTSQMGTVPNTFYARPGSNVGAAGADVYWTLAQFGSADGKEAVDRELAELFLAKTDAANPVAKQLLAQGYRPAALDGHRPQNSQGDTVHRRGTWLVGLGGMHNQRAHAECYGWLEDGTNYAWYTALGGLMVLTRDATGRVDTGFDERGWDWCHWPGTTSARHAEREMFSQYTWYSSNSPLAGAVAIDGDGVWAIDVRSQDASCRKSAFCFGDRITVVTSGIAGGGDRAKMTTLYQQRLGDVGAPDLAATVIDGRRVAALGEETLDTDKPHWLLDGRGHGYVVAPGGGKLVVRRGEQSWLYPYGRYLKDAKQNPKVTNSTAVKWAVPGSTPEQVLATPRGERYPREIEAYYRPSTGVFASAWLDHGAKAESADNAFTLVPQATPERLAELARALPYRLVQRTNAAHVLLDLATGTFGYALFEAGALAGAGPLLSASRPCFALSRPAGGALRLAVASSDGQANGTDGVTMNPGTGGGYPLPGTPLALTIAGAWQVDTVSRAGCAVTAKAVGGNTELTLKLPWRLGLEVRLKR